MQEHLARIAYKFISTSFVLGDMSFILPIYQCIETRISWDKMFNINIKKLNIRKLNIKSFYSYSIPHLFILTQVTQALHQFTKIVNNQCRSIRGGRMGGGGGGGAVSCRRTQAPSIIFEIFFLYPSKWFN